MNLQLERTEAAWAECAAQVDMIVACQQDQKNQASPAIDESAHEKAR